MSTKVHYNSFAEFYPRYLSEHRNRTSRRLHFLGTGLGSCILCWGIIQANASLIGIAFICGYGFAWVGYFFFEKNRPATFQYPLYSLMGDFRMFFDICRRSIPL